MVDKSTVYDTDLETILVVEVEVLARTALSEYLRDCGYRVIEASSADEAITMLSEPGLVINVVVSDVEMPGSMDGFGLAKWVRANKPGVEIILASTLQKAADVAGELCDEGPHLKKPYEPSQLVDWIKRLRAGN